MGLFLGGTGGGGGRRRRSSEIAPMLFQGVLPSAGSSNAMAVDTASHEHPPPQSQHRRRGWSQRHLVQPDATTTTAPTSALATSTTTTTTGVAADAGEPLPSTNPRPPPRHLQRLAHSVMSLRRQESAERDAGGGATAAPAADQTTAHDPWGQVLDRVIHKTAAHRGPRARTPSTAEGGGESKRVSLSAVLRSREVKELVTQALVTRHWHGRPASSAERSSVMADWVKASMLRNAARADDEEDPEGGGGGPDGDVQSGFDVGDATHGAMYGRVLLLEESCRRAFAQSGENRSQMDLQALKAWFQMTKLKVTNDFERFQPAELDLLCRRLTLLHFLPHEVVFRQGEEGDAMYIVFAGTVEVRVGQRILGEKVEVTVCELTKGDYFGERALLNNDPRAATIVATEPSELVRITREDYNIMLKKDQQEFMSRMQLSNGLITQRTLQQTQQEYIRVLSKKKHTRTKPDIDMLSEYLQTLKFFRGLPKTFIRELCTVVDYLVLPGGSYVFKEGEVGDLFYIIFSGSVDVIVNSKDNRGHAQQTKLINLTEGSHFGELALMKGHGIRSATVQTREECKFLVICEKDYNATLRRMQKEELAKRVGVLDKIPMFQTPEWTGELLKEMSYVLSEQKLATGTVLFRQGERAMQVYFVVRGELVVTKEIVDPVKDTKSVVFVERIGRYRVVGDDAAAGVHFNESIFREITVTASTPVEVLVLSKYDVFHRLSRAARETLRAAAHSHVESVVYLDRYHKTTKWDAYKQKLVQEHLNHDRLAKILPQRGPERCHTAPQRSPVPARDPAASSSDVLAPRLLTDSTMPTLTSSDRGVHTAPSTSEAAKVARKRVIEEMDAVCQQSMLVNANEFLLLEPVPTALDRCFSPSETLAHHVTSFNADAPPSAARQRHLASALRAERRRQVDILNEGNPLAYFDVPAVHAKQRQQQHETRGRATSTRRLLIRAAGLGESGTFPHPHAGPTLSPMLSGDPTAASSTAADAAGNNVMNQFLQENFIFSHPEQHAQWRPSTTARAQRKTPSPRRSKKSSRLPSVAAVAPLGGNNDDGPPSPAAVAAAAVEALAPVVADPAYRLAEELCVGDLVLVDVVNAQENDEVQSPTFRILRAARSSASAREVLVHARLAELSDATRQDLIDGSVDDQFLLPTAFTTFALERRRFAVMPRPALSKAAEEAAQAFVVGRFGRAPTRPQPWPSASATTGGDVGGGAPPSPTTNAPGPICGSFEAIKLSLTEQRDAALAATRLGPPDPGQSLDPVLARRVTAPKTASPGKAPTTTTAPGGPSATAASLGATPIEPASLALSAPGLFAIVSMVLSKRELESAQCDEPFLCVHALHPTEAEAMTAALSMGPRALRNALLCILPANEWIRFDEAFEWCVQVESDRRDKTQQGTITADTHRTSPSTAAAAAAAASGAGGRAPLRRTGSITSIGQGPIPSRHPPVPEWQLEKEKARRLHQFVCSRMGLKPQDRERRAEITGFTPRPTVSLEDKLGALQEHLRAAATHGPPSKSTALLGKYRQMKRFGSIMRARLTTTVATTASPSPSHHRESTIATAERC